MEQDKIEIKLITECDYSEAAIEYAHELLYSSLPTKQSYSLILTISVFDIVHAVSLMVRNDGLYKNIKYIHVDPYFSLGDWQLETKSYKPIYFIKSCT